ncbi:glycosyltransferase family 2 protein [Infirmifilum lucidum]|uniref:Glycosyltransferase family 2 protein n=1 Tax=Infirmifilum lucidum TaxID=2776706 RepID=A0A7L9FHM8_9CREN|nr:glycosyltransferase family 2 protein [Infirmifilum lucidum]QOJ79269.1 glycosyltransferase family 2 protein [Infirmifilum lucidum]
MNPLTSIIWVNHNSYRFINLTLESLEGALNIDYSPVELIVIDNGSTDGSFEYLKNYIELRKPSDMKVKIIRLNKNIGFTAAVNIGYASRSKDAKYVVLLNNDAVPYPESLATLIEVMEQNPGLGAVQGIIVSQSNPEIIDTAGGFLSELLTSHMAYRGMPRQTVKKGFYITYADGSYAVYSIDALKKSLKNDKKIFYDFAYGYFDDDFIGLKLWNRGFKIASLPIVAAKHHRGSTFGKVKPLQIYLGFRGLIALSHISNSRLKGLVSLLALRSFSPVACYGIPAKECKQLIYSQYKAYLMGRRMGKILSILGEDIDLYRAPIVRIPLHLAIPYLVLIRKLHEYVDKKIVKLVEELQVDF